VLSDMNYTEISLTTLSTILAGTFVYLLSRYIEELLLKPVLEMKAIIRKTENYLILYASVVDASLYSQEYIKQISHEFRDLAATLVSNLSAIPLYRVLRLLFGYHRRDISGRLQKTSSDIQIIWQNLTILYLLSNVKISKNFYALKHCN
jgi:hypothetical protein